MMIGDKLVKSFQVKDKPMTTIFFRSDKNIRHYSVAIMTAGLNDILGQYLSYFMSVPSEEKLTAGCVIQ